MDLADGGFALPLALLVAIGGTLVLADAAGRGYGGLGSDPSSPGVGPYLSRSNPRTFSRGISVP